MKNYNDETICSWDGKMILFAQLMNESALFIGILLPFKAFTSLIKDINAYLKNNNAYFETLDQVKKDSG